MTGGRSAPFEWRHASGQREWNSESTHPKLNRRCVDGTTNLEVLPSWGPPPWRAAVECEAV